MTRPAFEVADILRAQGDRFLERYRSSIGFQQLKAFRAILRCRTAALGGHIDVCQRCGYQANSYNSCRNRSCPKCQAQSRERWLAARRTRTPGHQLFPCCVHRAPRTQLAGDWKISVCFTTCCSPPARELLKIAADPKHLGAEIGILSHPPHLGPEPTRASAHPLCDSRGRALAGPPWMDPHAILSSYPKRF